ncbi:MAG TPA: exosortase A [Novosphingobium sp.]|nr:exosortase A [Novosphingobium sp.]
MPPEALALSTRPGIPQAWRAPLIALAAAWLGLAALFAADWRDMAAQWWDISTYNHILLVPAIVAWLVNLRRPELAKLSPMTWPPGLVMVAGALLIWVLGGFAGLSVARQLGVVVMLQGALVTLLGPRVARGLAFPLAYLLFLVPLGEELVPALQLLTARMTMGLLGLSGIPALLEGVFITTPTAIFKVAEACSGVKFLIAMIAFGALVANVCFRAWPRRLAFVTVAVVVPILANGVRAWGTILIAHYRGIEFAAGFDHVFYGWVFFAAVIALVLALGWRFFDRAIDDPMIDAQAIEADPRLARIGRFSMRREAALAAIALLAIAASGWSLAAARLAAPVPAHIALLPVPGWQRADYTPAEWWQPRHTGAAHRLLGRYENSAGDAVDVSYALYAAQGEGREAGGFGEGALTPETDWAWRSPGPEIVGARVDRLAAPGPVERVAATWYKTGDLVTASNARLKLANIADRLVLRRRTTSVLIVSAEERPGRPAPRAIRRFLDATGDPGAWMDRLAMPR